MTTVTFALKEDYWDNFELTASDTDFIYNHLLEIETPLTTKEIIYALINDRIRREILAIEKRRTSGGDLYQPKGTYEVDQALIFPAFDWQKGIVMGIREGQNPDLGNFNVIEVSFENGDNHEFAAGLLDHVLNEPPEFTDDYPELDQEFVITNYLNEMTEVVEEDLSTNPDFVRIAGKWFPKALLVDINVGHLNIAEAVLDMNNGGPSTTSALLEQVELDANVNPKLLEFSLDLALQEDDRFDEVGSAGDVLWFLKRLEPESVLNPPIYLDYHPIEYDRDVLDEQMLELESELDDELSPGPDRIQKPDEVDICLIFPHLQAGTLPLSHRVSHLFPTAYEAPRIRFTIIDGDTGEEFPSWVVRKHRYVYGLQEWYLKHDLLAGSEIRIKRGKLPGQVIIKPIHQRSSRDWIKTVLVGSDGGIVFAMLKQLIPGEVDQRMGIATPDTDALAEVWQKSKKTKPPFEQTVVNIVKELAKLNPQSHVHASELYAAINVIRRCPPGPIFALLASRPWFSHVGDLHFRLSEHTI